MRRAATGNTRCVDGRTMRHDPQHDDPYLETDIGQCEECEGAGCSTCAKCGCETRGEVAMVDGAEWCHSCADDAAEASAP